LLEPLDATTRVDELLLARVERVALGADLDGHVALGGARLELVPTRALDDRELVLRVDISLHGTQPTTRSAACSAASTPSASTSSEVTTRIVVRSYGAARTPTSSSSAQPPAAVSSGRVQAASTMFVATRSTSSASREPDARPFASRRALAWSS